MIYFMQSVDGGPLADDSALPPGKTCRDCKHFAPKCSWLIASLTGDETGCDWAPSRFAAKGEASPAPAD